jgi:hypothetical protein
MEDVREVLINVVNVELCHVFAGHPWLLLFLFHCAVDDLAKLYLEILGFLVTFVHEVGVFLVKLIETVGHGALEIRFLLLLAFALVR